MHILSTPKKENTVFSLTFPHAVHVLGNIDGVFPDDQTRLWDVLENYKKLKRYLISPGRNALNWKL